MALGYVSPSTNIVMLKNCVLQKSDNDETDTLLFSSVSEQNTYFATAGNFSARVVYSNNTYQNVGKGVLRLGATMKEALGYNYMYFTNNGVDANNDVVFEGKTYYCFVDDIRYINNNCVEISYSLDYLQTFMFDYSEKTCLVERMTTDDDEVGTYVLDEGLDLGSSLVVSNYSSKFFDGDWSYAPVLASEVSLIGDTVWYVAGTSYLKFGDYGVLMGSQTLSTSVTGLTEDVVAPLEYWVLDFTTIPTQLNGVIKAPMYLNIGVTIYDVVNVKGSVVFNEPVIDINNSRYRAFGSNNDYMSRLYSGGEAFSAEDYTKLMNNVLDVLVYPNSFVSGLNYGGISDVDVTISYPTALDGLTPKNNKMLTYPYISLVVATSNGDSENFRYEWFNPADNNRVIKFKLESVVLPSVQCLLSPMNYKKYDGGTATSVCRDLSLPITVFPKYHINTDTYKMYIGKNLYRDSFGIVNSLLNMGIGIVAGAPAVGGAAMSTFNTMTEMVSRYYEASLQPPGLIGQVGTGDVKVARGKFGYSFLGMSVDYEHAMVIDNYFTRYGYKLARSIVPSRNNNGKRKNFTFIKTVECNITIVHNNMTQDDEKAIEAIYNRGVRFWYGRNNGVRLYKDYSVDNPIVSV